MRNLRQALDVADRCMKRGHQPFVPGLTCLWDLVEPHDYERWMEYDFAWLAVCGAVIRVPGPSVGADREELFAIEHEIPVFHGIEAFMASGLWVV